MRVPGGRGRIRSAHHVLRRKRRAYALREQVKAGIDIGSDGRPRIIIAGTDCEFETIDGYVLVAEDVVWPKLSALSAGPEIASRRLMG